MAMATDPVCGMQVDTDDAPALGRVRRQDVLLLLAGVP